LLTLAVVEAAQGVEVLVQVVVVALVMVVSAVEMAALPQ
jgi:hypothetical protein